MNQYFAGFDLGGTFLKYGMGNHENGIVYDSKLAVETSDMEYLYSLFTEGFRDMKNHLVSTDIIAGVCIGSPGTANSETGRVEGINPNLPGWSGANPVMVLNSRWNIPILIDNDANLMTYGEYSAYPEAESILGITIGTGIGSGFVNRNGIFHGTSYSALEIGHTIVNRDGFPCNCGKKGCIEAYASANSMVRILSPYIHNIQQPSIKDILDHALDNSELNSQLCALIDLLAVALANAVTILNPAILVIGGGAVDIASYPYQYLQERILAYLMKDHCKPLTIARAKYGNKAAILGGILLAEKQYSLHEK